MAFATSPPSGQQAGAGIPTKFFLFVDRYSVMLKPVITSSLLLMFCLAHAWLARPMSAQEPRLLGRWRVEYSFSDAAKSVLQFDARESGKGSFLSMDTRRSNLAPAIPGDAVWTQTANRVSFFGEIDIPIGNVGYQMTKLRFEGTFKAATVILGEVTYVTDEQVSKKADQPKGTFRATRIDESKAIKPPRQQ